MRRQLIVIKILIFENFQQLIVKLIVKTCSPRQKAERSTESDRQRHRQRDTYINVSAVNKQVMQADAEAAAICCRCYDDNWPITAVVKQCSDSCDEHH